MYDATHATHSRPKYYRITKACGHVCRKIDEKHHTPLVWGGGGNLHIYRANMTWSTMQLQKIFPIYNPIQSLTTTTIASGESHTLSLDKKISKQLNRQALSHDVGKLVRGRHVELPNLAQDDTCRDKQAKIARTKW